MLNIRYFTGIDNQRESRELKIDPKTGATPLASALNVDLDIDGHMTLRPGLASVDTGIHRGLFEATAGLFAIKAGDLINAATAEVLYPSLSGTPRAWYTNLPDGRTTFSNSLICGITDGTTAGTTKWGVPLPDTAGNAAATTGGALMPGRYKWQVTHVRTLDGLEGGPTYGGTLDLAVGDTAIVWTGLPLLDGHTTNVYLSSHNGDLAYLAATTSGTTAAFTGANVDLQLECKTDNCVPAPAGICTAFWRGRMLMAVGNLLIASRPHQWELFDLARDFKAFSADLTLVQPVDGGIWVGTSDELAFLAGTEYEKLVAHHSIVDGPVALGSGVAVDARNIKGDGQGPAMVCLADGYITAGMGDGSARVLTDNTYRRAEVDEVVATFRMNGSTPQYIAIPV